MSFDLCNLSRIIYLIRILFQMDSVFNLQRPYDLVALLKQEERAEMLEHLKQELLSKKADIDQNEDQDTGIAMLMIASHRDIERCA